MNNKVTITTSSKIAALAATIHLHTTKLDEYFISHGISSPTFDINSPASYKLPDDIAGSRNAVLEATDELHMLMLGPVAFLTTLHVRIANLDTTEQSDSTVGLNLPHYSSAL